MKKYALFFVMLVLFTTFLKAQTNALIIKTDSLIEHPKTGYSFGGLPLVGFSTDYGELYGVFFNILNFGNGKIYPKYYQNLFIAATVTTKGGQTYQMNFDSEHLIKGLRFTADITNLTEQTLPFYGFNGKQSIYDPRLVDENSTAYISRMFYRFDRNLTRILLNVEGSLGIPGLKWLSGVQSINFKIHPVNVDELNKGLKKSEILPHVDGLYDDYVKWGLIDKSEMNGGLLNYLLSGIIYDTRDNESNPTKGLWTEAIMAIALGAVNPGNGFTRISITHRQYFTLIPKRLTFAYRLNWQQTVTGRTPFYFLPYQLTSKPFSITVDGLGGANTIRGILRNRLTGEAVALANSELRFKAWQSYWLKQNFYIAFTFFYDAGMVTNRRAVDLSLVPPADRQKYFDENATGHLSQSAGVGMHFVMNQNFNVAFDYGRAFSKIDGTFGFYISLGYLF